MKKSCKCITPKVVEAASELQVHAPFPFEIATCFFCSNCGEYILAFNLQQYKIEHGVEYNEV